MALLLGKSVFVHVPRTGGTWFAALCRQLGLVRGDTDDGGKGQHVPFSSLPADWRALPAFGFVREPLAWVRSRWAHTLRGRDEGDAMYPADATPDFHDEFYLHVRTTLRATLESLLARPRGLVSETYRLTLAGCTALGRTEDLPGAAHHLLRRFEGLSIAALPWVDGGIPRNSVAAEPAYGEEIDDNLALEFLAQENDAVTIWRAAALGAPRSPLPYLDGVR